MLTITLYAAVVGPAHADSHYNSITFFGDSLTDGGYFSPVTQQIPGVTESGQFTTNPDNTWATPFAHQLGLTSLANTFGGQTGNQAVHNQAINNYAIGGAKAGVEVTNSNFGFDIPVASASSQIDQYLANNKIDPNGLYVVWAGANDLLAASEDSANAQNIIGSAVNSQVMNIKKLSDKGAKYILVPNIPDIGLTPDVVGTAAQGPSTYVTNQFNQAMLKGADNIDANVIPLDTFGLLQQVAASPETYGFNNVTDKACLTDSSLICGKSARVAADANETYFFADSVHPTGQAHKMIADYANAVVTAPNQMAILPHLATTAGFATNERLQSHINQTQSANSSLTTNSSNNSAIRATRNVWAMGDVEGQDIDNLESSGNAQLLVGMDFAYANSAHAVTGIYANVTKKEFNNNDVNSGLSDIELDEFGVGVYHSNTFDNLGGIQVNGALGFGKLDMDVTRAVKLGDYTQKFKSNADGKRYYANLQAGYPMQFSHTTMTPYLGASVSRVNIDALKEVERSGIAMQFDEQEYTTSYGKIGLKGNRNLSDTLNLFGDVYYQKQLSDDQDEITARLNSLPDNSFTTPQPALDEDSFGMTLGLSHQFGQFNANAGVTHTNAKEDDATSVFFGFSRAF